MRRRAHCGTAVLETNARASAGWLLACVLVLRGAAAWRRGITGAAAARLGRSRRARQHDRGQQQSADGAVPTYARLLDLTSCVRAQREQAARRDSVGAGQQGARVTGSVCFGGSTCATPLTGWCCSCAGAPGALASNECRCLNFSKRSLTRAVAYRDSLRRALREGDAGRKEVWQLGKRARPMNRRCHWHWLRWTASWVPVSLVPWVGAKRCFVLGGPFKVCFVHVFFEGAVRKCGGWHQQH